MIKILLEGYPKNLNLIVDLKLAKTPPILILPMRTHSFIAFFERIRSVSTVKKEIKNKETLRF